MDTIENNSFLKNPLIVALDLDDFDYCLELIRVLGPLVGGIKLGPRLVIRYGKEIIHQASHFAPVFLDMKFLDIPNTMEHSVRAAFEMGASLVTIHAQSGREALKRLSHLENELSKERPFKILVVTVLTSFSTENLPSNMKSMSISDHVNHLALDAYQSGLRGFVCSPHEAQALRQNYPDSFIVTPGVRRIQGSINDDQKRVMTPAEAIKQGASAIVVGRPILEAKGQEREEAKLFLKELFWS